MVGVVVPVSWWPEDRNVLLCGRWRRCPRASEGRDSIPWNPMSCQVGSADLRGSNATEFFELGG